jgi:hypothetical protein
MTDWMPCLDHGLGVDTPMFGALGWLCGLEEARFDSGPSELLDVRSRQTADEGCIGHFWRGFLGGGDTPETRRLVLPGVASSGVSWSANSVSWPPLDRARKWRSRSRGAGRRVVMQRDRGQAREAVGAGTFQRLDRECCANAVSVEIVCDFDRDVGEIWLIGQLDVARDGDE